MTARDVRGLPGFRQAPQGVRQLSDGARSDFEGALQALVAISPGVAARSRRGGRRRVLRIGIGRRRTRALLVALVLLYWYGAVRGQQLPRLFP